MSAPDLPRSVASTRPITPPDRPDGARAGPPGLRVRFAEFLARVDPGHPVSRRLAAWPIVRARALERFEDLDQARRDGRELGERVWSALLPHDDTPIARSRNAFIHPSPVVPDDLRDTIEQLVGPDGAARLARALFDTVRRSLDDPAEHWSAVEELLVVPGAGSLDARALSPILHALRPEAYVLVDAATAACVSEHSGRRLGTCAADWASLNAEALKLLAGCGDIFALPGCVGRHPSDLLHALVHWTPPVAAHEPALARAPIVMQPVDGGTGRQLTVTMPDGGRLALPARSRLIIEVGSEHPVRIVVSGAD